MSPSTSKCFSPLKLPVNTCVSSAESPNFVEPLVKIIEALVISVWNSCAVNVPETLKLPSADILNSS